MVAAVETEPEFRTGEPRALFEARYERALLGFTNYDVAPDGSFVMVRGDRQPPPRRINIVLNWFEELKQKVPVE